MATLGADKLFFVTTNPEDQAEEALNGMFKFLASKETDAVKEITIRYLFCSLLEVKLL